MSKRSIAAAIAVAGAAAVTTLTGPAPALADTVAVTHRETIPIAFPTYVPCANGGAGELVDLTGDLLSVFYVTETDEGLHLTFHVNPQGVTGTGATTGDIYRGTGVGQGSVRLSGGAMEATFVDNFKIIGPGPDNNLLIHGNFHVRISATGEFVVVADNFSAECR